MNQHYLKSLFEPESVAVFGASERNNSVGAVVLRNLVEGGFKGKIFPVNPKHDKVIDSFMDSIAYVNRLGFTVSPGFPGWIVQAQERLANAASKLWKAGNPYPFTVHYYRKRQQFIVNNSVVLDARDW